MAKLLFIQRAENDRQGITFVFDEPIASREDGIKSKEWWFSWEYIASKMFDQKIEAVNTKGTKKRGD